MRGTARVFVDAAGRPATVRPPDGDPLGKLSNGVLAHREAGPAFLAIRWADRGAGMHLVEGLADALAVAARAEGAVVATFGTAFGRLADPLARVGAPVRVWPDGDGPGRAAARKLLADLRRRGAVASMVPVPDGSDPAALAGPL